MHREKNSKTNKITSPRLLVNKRKMGFAGDISTFVGVQINQWPDQDRCGYKTRISVRHHHFHWGSIPIPASVCFSLRTKKFEIEKRTVYLSTENHYIEQV